MGADICEGLAVRNNSPNNASYFLSHQYGYFSEWLHNSANQCRPTFSVGSSSNLNLGRRRRKPLDVRRLPTRLTINHS